jgi:hypothetical protein
MARTVFGATPAFSATCATLCPPSSWRKMEARRSTRADSRPLLNISATCRPMQTKKLQIIPLGGLGRIRPNKNEFPCLAFGMNCLRWEDDIIVIDAGLMFPESELLGVDIVVPDITYLIENKQHVRAIVLTHGHEDHIGGLPWILSELKVPVYAPSSRWPM